MSPQVEPSRTDTFATAGYNYSDVLALPHHAQFVSVFVAFRKYNHVSGGRCHDALQLRAGLFRRSAPAERGERGEEEEEEDEEAAGAATEAGSDERRFAVVHTSNHTRSLLCRQDVEWCEETPLLFALSLLRSLSALN
jgi:hypothetical protein